MDNKLSNVWVPRDLIVRDSSNTKVTAKAGQKLFSFSISRQANRIKRARVRRCLVSVNGFVTVSRAVSLLFFLSRACLSCSASPSLSVSVCLEVAGGVLLLTGLSEQREGNHMGVRERENARAFERELFRGPRVSFL